MQELLPPNFGDVSDGSFSQAILKMGIGPTVGESLLPLGAMVDDRVVSKAAIVGMVVFDGDKMVGGKLFESLFCFDCLIAGHACHHVDVAEAGEVVDKDGCCLVALDGQLAFELGDKAWLCGNHLVN